MRINGTYWQDLSTFKLHVSFWEENWNPNIFGWFLSVMGFGGQPESTPDLRGIKVDIAEMSADKCWPLVFTEAELLGDLHALDLTSRDVRFLAGELDWECRCLRIDDPSDWRKKLVLHLRGQESSLLLDEVCAANPGRSVSSDGAGISVG